MPGDLDQMKTAYNMIVPLAEKGKAAAQFVLGMMYFKGRGVEKNIIARLILRCYSQVVFWKKIVVAKMCNRSLVQHFLKDAVEKRSKGI